MFPALSRARTWKACPPGAWPPTKGDEHAVKGELSRLHSKPSIPDSESEPENVKLPGPNRVDPPFGRLAPFPSFEERMLVSGGVASYLITMLDEFVLPAMSEHWPVITTEAASGPE